MRCCGASTPSWARGPAVSADDALLAAPRPSVTNTSSATSGRCGGHRARDRHRPPDGPVHRRQPDRGRRGRPPGPSGPRPLIYQPAIFDGRFVGFADFLTLSDNSAGPGRYRVGDTKLARSAKVEALLQLAAYADTLAAAGVPIDDEAELILGDGAIARYRVDEIVPVYRRRRAALEHLLDRHHAAGDAVCWTDEHVRACFRCPSAS